MLAAFYYRRWKNTQIIQTSRGQQSKLKWTTFFFCTVVKLNIFHISKMLLEFCTRKSKILKILGSYAQNTLFLK